MEFGLLIETLETATDWSSLLDLHAGSGRHCGGLWTGFRLSSLVIVASVSRGGVVVFHVVASRASDERVGQWMAPSAPPAMLLRRGAGRLRITVPWAPITRRGWLPRSASSGSKPYVL